MAGCVDDADSDSAAGGAYDDDVGLHRSLAMQPDEQRFHELMYRPNI